MSKPIVEGGIGVQSLVEFNDVGIKKLAWEFLRKNKQWEYNLKGRGPLSNLLIMPVFLPAKLRINEKELQ